MQWIRGSENPEDVAVLNGYAGLVFHMPEQITMQNSLSLRDSIVFAWRERGTPSNVILDMSETRHVDSSGAGLLLEMWQRAKAGHLPISICGLLPGPRKMLLRTGILDRFEQCPSSEAMVPPPMAVEPVTTTCKKQRSHAVLWTVDALLAIAILAGATYGFWQLGAYQGQMDHQLTPIHRWVAGAGRRSA